MLTRSQTRNQTSPTSMITRSQSRNKFFEEEEEVVIRAPTLRNRRAIIVDVDDYNSRTHSMTTRSMKR